MIDLQRLLVWTAMFLLDVQGYFHWLVSDLLTSIIVNVASFFETGCIALENSPFLQSAKCKPLDFKVLC